MQIEVGKRYVRRDGSLSGVIESRMSVDYPFRDKITCHTLTSTGKVYMGTALSDFDLVAEYVEPVSPSEVSGKESAVEYDLSGIPTGYEFVGCRPPKQGEWMLSPIGEAIRSAVDFQDYETRIVVKPITPPEPKQRTVVIHKWLVWDFLGKERMVFGTKKYIGNCGFSDAVDLGLYEEVKVNV